LKLNVEEFDMVGLGDTGPSWRMRALRRRSSPSISPAIIVYRISRRYIYPPSSTPEVILYSEEA
jgi:hypothetical protein